ncbi:MAG: type II/IV secretion system protein [Armatimonadetes bacterium]|nr:type II/IV secretion system protein [Armatimonadota bacterium]MDE2206326.1 type II/IV secretion system protein [Armatimonadota bacterium]
MAQAAIRLTSGRLAELLIEDEIIDSHQLERAEEYQRQTGTFLGQALVSLNVATPQVLGDYLEAATGFPYVCLADRVVDATASQLIPERIARRKQVLAFAESRDALEVAMADPLDLDTVDDLRLRLNRPIVQYLALESDLQDAINRVYDIRGKAQSALDEINIISTVEAELSPDELADLAEDAPIVRLVNGIVQAAVTSGASDIHIEPQEDTVRVRFRQDGLLYEQMTIPRQHVPAVVSRIKIVSGMNIAERRRPQDGRFAFSTEDGVDFDLRVSIMPVKWGEKVVMRVLAKSSAFASRDRLGLFPEQQEQFDRFLKRPHGIILVTGPTGSGKSTTLFAALNLLNDSSRNVNTIEDPVEYELRGVNQMQVVPQIGVTFAAGLRTLVRQDPDVIMVGEIRDGETAEIAIQAALTGHLVLSTLHTNDAPSSLTRLQNMGVEPFLISSAMVGVVGQRLLRTICTNCKEEMQATRAMVEALDLPVKGNKLPMLAHGKGCHKCGQRGMKGRTAVYEITPMSDALRELVLKRADGAQLRGQAIAEGMITMRESARRKVLAGVTTPEEVARVLFAEE